MSSYELNPELYSESVKQEPIRTGFGRGLKAAGETNKNIVALCADLTDSSACAELWEEALAWRGSIEVLVNNAGAWIPRPWPMPRVGRPTWL